MELDPIERKFILHWGEMGTKWGVNRTVAQIHALLYVRDEPLNAEQIATTLQVARSNVSASLRQLQSWGIVKTEPVLGDRRDHYLSTKNVWKMFEKLLDKRKRREYDPTIAVLAQCLQKAEKAQAPARIRQRLGEMHACFETMANWYTQIRRLPTGPCAAFSR